MYRTGDPYSSQPPAGYGNGSGSTSPAVVPPQPTRPSTRPLETPVVLVANSSPSGPPVTAALDCKPKTGERSGIKRSAKACNHCRKGKARCDGFDSYPCRRCRESGVECIFEGIPVEELLQRSHRFKEEGGVAPRSVQESTPVTSSLEARLRGIEQELDRLNSHNRKLEARIDTLGRSTVRGDTTPSTPVIAEESSEALAREAFDLFWQHYAPLAPYISPTEDRYEDVRTRSPLLTHSIIAVASRFEVNREFVESNRSEARRLLRETLFAETPLTLDDLKGILLFSAWLGRGAPPGHSVSLALQLDLPRSLERLLASIASPPEDAARAFDQLIPAVRIWLTLYAQDLWLSFAMGRRSMVTIDLSITNARLLLNFAALRPVDARLIAQSELVTILGIVQETFLKMQHQTPSHSVDIVNQANGHLSNWIKTWSEWANNQHDSASGRYVLASLTMLLQGGRFYSNTLGLRDITKPEELLPMHMPCLRTALDAAVRIQGIHPAQKIAHAAEFTLITLSTSALFLLKMVKLAPHAFSSYSAPFYPSFTTPTTSPAAAAGSVPDLTASVDPSSPDVSASLETVHPPSIAQALEAVRHSTGLLASVPARQRNHYAAVVAALQKLETELGVTAQLPPPTTTTTSRLVESFSGGRGVERGGGGGRHEGRTGTDLEPQHGGGGFDDFGRAMPPGGVKRARGNDDDDDDDDDEGPEGGLNDGHRHRARQPRVDVDTTTPGSTQYADFSNVPSAAADAGFSRVAQPFENSSTGHGRDETIAPPPPGAARGEGAGAGAGAEGGIDEYADLSIASLVGTQAFWSWESTLPGDINAGLSSIFS